MTSKENKPKQSDFDYRPISKDDEKEDLEGAPRRFRLVFGDKEYVFTTIREENNYPW